MGMTVNRITMMKDGLSSVELSLRANEVADLLKTLSHPARLMIVCTLVEGEYSVGRMEQKIGSSTAPVAASNGVAQFRNSRDATGRETDFYRLTEEKAAQLVASLYDIFCVEKAK